MPIDSSIAMGYQPIKLENPMNQLAQIMQLEASQKQNRLADLQMKTHQQTFDDKNKLNDIYAGAVNPDGSINRAKLLQSLASGGMGSQLPAIQKGFYETDEAKQKVDKGSVELFDASMKQRRGELAGVTSPEDYLAWHQGNHSDPILGPLLSAKGVKVGDAMPKVQAALQKPGGLQELIQQSALGMDKFIELNKPSYQKTNNGKVETLLAIPGIGGAPVPVNTTTMTTTPGEDLTAQTAAAGRAVTIRGQNLTDARSRDANAIAGETKKTATDQAKAGQVASFDVMLDSLDRLGKHPGLSRSVGKMSVTPTMPGSDSANFQAELETFKSQAFIPMVSQLKGMGALSDAEGKKLTAAVGALDPKMGETAFRESVGRITSQMNDARSRVSGDAKPAAPTPAKNPQGWALHTDAKGNKAYVSPDGKQFQEVK